MSTLQAGQTAPDFTIETLEGSVSLSQALQSAERGVVVYFYPKAGTPGCTTEACDFRDNLGSLKGAGYTVIGISPDDLESLRQFAEAEFLNFTLGSDPDHPVAEQWGAWGEKQIEGRTVIGVIRSTFVISPDGQIVLAQYNVQTVGHVAELRRQLGID